jgi:hypothetical protein
MLATLLLAVTVATVPTPHQRRCEQLRAEYHRTRSAEVKHGARLDACRWAQVGWRLDGGRTYYYF